MLSLSPQKKVKKMFNKYNWYHICNINIIYIHKDFIQLNKITKKNRQKTNQFTEKNTDDYMR